MLLGNGMVGFHGGGMLLGKGVGRFLWRYGAFGEFYCKW